MKKVGLEAFGEDGGGVVIVQDHGDGFDAAGALNSQGKGLNSQGKGFGLATLRQRLQLLGGSLDLISVPGDGTRVTVTLPSETLQEPDKVS